MDQDVVHRTELPRLAEEFNEELLAIANWWLKHSVDNKRGGFYGEVGADNEPVPDADKGVVLNTRILWFFSELAGQVDDLRYTALARRAYEYFTARFIDGEQGGVFWALNAHGDPIDTKKQVYAQAFAIYALLAYYQLTGEQQALDDALSCFELLEKHTVDRKRGGYLEAFTRDWNVLDDVRLSDKDLNFPKTMNTHLHVVEAYTTLHQVAPSAPVKAALRYSIECFDQRIINKDNYHLRMFMDHDWQDYSPGFTYGHDIECSWLLAKATDSLGDLDLSKALHPSILNLADVCLAEALGEHGEMLDSYDFNSGQRETDRIWWVQAEALVGFLTVHALTGEQRYLSAAERVWQFTKQYQIDSTGGEWLWASSLDEPHDPPHYKLGFWKGPYHNGRAMMEASRLLAAAGASAPVLNR